MRAERLRGNSLPRPRQNGTIEISFAILLGGEVCDLGVFGWRVFESSPETSVAESEISSSGLKVGYWEGDSPVSFEVTDDGNLHNFHLVAPLSIGECTIKAEEIEVESKGTFESIYSVSTSEFNPIALDVLRSQEVELKITETESAEMIELYNVSGTFDKATKLIGTVKITICVVDGTVNYDNNVSTWSAEWKRSIP